MVNDKDVSEWLNNQYKENNKPKRSIGQNYSADFLRVAVEQAEISNNQDLREAVARMKLSMLENNLSYEDVVDSPADLDLVITRFQELGADSYIMDNIGLAIQSYTTSDEEIKEGLEARRNNVRPEKQYELKRSPVNGNMYYVNKTNPKDYMTQEEYSKVDATPDALGWGDDFGTHMLRDVDARSTNNITAKTEDVSAVVNAGMEKIRD